AVLPRTVLVALLVGLLVTVISAYAPARRASKTPPVEAMREEFASAGDSLRVRTLVGVVLAVIGTGLVVLGAQSTGGTAATIVGIGALALTLAVLLASPAVSQPVVGALGALFKPFGPVGRMARNNAVRNPRRTAATAFALTLGLMLVTAIGMLGASAKESIGVLVDKGVQSDFVLVGPSQQLIGLPLAVPDAVRQNVPDAAEVVGFRGVAVRIGDDRTTGVSPDVPIGGALNYEIVEGTGTLGDSDILVSQKEAEEHGLSAGQSIELTGLDRNQKVSVTVAGIYRDTPLLSELVVPPAVFDQVTPPTFRSNFFVLVTAREGADPAALRTALEEATDQFVIVQVQDREEFKGAQGQQINTMLAILYGLLALAVVIAI